MRFEIDERRRPDHDDGERQGDLVFREWHGEQRAGDGAGGEAFGAGQRAENEEDRHAAEGRPDQVDPVAAMHAALGVREDCRDRHACTEVRCGEQDQNAQ